jgi:hypothetical protein
MYPRDSPPATRISLVSSVRGWLEWNGRPRRDFLRDVATVSPHSGISCATELRRVVASATATAGSIGNIALTRPVQPQLAKPVPRSFHSPYQPTDAVWFHEMLDSLRERLIVTPRISSSGLGIRQGRALLMAWEYACGLCALSPSVARKYCGRMRAADKNLWNSSIRNLRLKPGEQQLTLQHCSSTTPFCARRKNGIAISWVITEKLINAVIETS